MASNVEQSYVGLRLRATQFATQPTGSTRPQSFWERVGEQGLHTGLRELSSLPIKKTRSKKMADARELQTNLTEYRAQLRQASYLIGQFYAFILNDTYI